ncbi:uncharacterized protein LOC129566183 [Sitodiplosis mosellana]|uniref:uncharacterized protein LOC129566183 n=1 Tax=Sitodiplosis mosellana TaxID=263140 RepID=UPI0024441D65|nr:uncharacterized protein LOC129566183 [Sitodiplosis mosellana]
MDNYQNMDPILIFNGVHIFPFDVDTLDSKELLNDAILDFYMKYLYQVVLAKEQRPKIEIFASTFYQKIMCEDQDNGVSQDVHILDKDFILLPVNLKEHWFLVIVCFPWNIACDFDTIDLKQMPRVIILDSSIGFLKSQHSGFLKKLHLFISKQIARESGRSINDLSARLPTDFVPIAQQSNDYDCGLFLLDFAEKFILDNFPSSENNFIPTSNDDAIDCDKKRKNIKDLIEHLTATETNQQNLLTYFST